MLQSLEHPVRLISSSPKSLEISKMSSQYSCHLCDKTYTRRSTLNTHIAHIHREIPRVACPHCAIQVRNLYSHLRQVHTTHTEHVCGFCDKPFPYRSSLKLHVRAKHLSTKYECPDCGSQFSWADSLKRHRDAVHQQMVFNCDFCDYQSSYKQDLKPHFQSIHQLRRYSCDRCTHEFRSVRALKRHQRAKHENIQITCPSCGFKTGYQGNLNRHILSQHQRGYGSGQ